MRRPGILLTAAVVLLAVLVGLVAYTLITHPTGTCSVTLQPAGRGILVPITECREVNP